ncbi:hypothetical protein HKCCE2091_04030 [Rhodobacterales bacterium HKCCE2091]|nr:hypothetical protein [Rhodobacterales bacterium HKCCE2091]
MRKEFISILAVTCFAGSAGHAIDLGGGGLGIDVDVSLSDGISADVGVGLGDVGVGASVGVGGGSLATVDAEVGLGTAAGATANTQVLGSNGTVAGANVGLNLGDLEASLDVLIGQPVITSDNVRIGSVSDVRVDPDTGCMMVGMAPAPGAGVSQNRIWLAGDSFGCGGELASVRGAPVNLNMSSRSLLSRIQN